MEYGEPFNYWYQIEKYKSEGYSEEEAEDLAYEDLMAIMDIICKEIDKK